MMCEKPFMKNPVCKRKPVTYEERLACTPVPCGQCFPCRVNKSREMSVRIMLEAAASEASCFVTLTYNEDFLPKGDKKNGERVGMCSLDKKELQKFIKRLRKRVEPIKLRYFATGEYGDCGTRPHFHLMIFGIGRESENVIKKCWSFKEKIKKKNYYFPLGDVDVGDVTNYSARYITNYAMKNFKNMDDDFIKKNFPLLFGREPEFKVSSKLEGGIGIKGLERVAESWNKNPHTRKEVINEFRLFGKMVPLGRYLRVKFAEMIGVTEDQFEQVLWDYQEDLFESFIMKGTIFYENIREWKAEERKAQRVRQRIFKQKRRV